MKALLTFLIIALGVALLSCQQSMPFDSVKWKITGREFENYPYREMMVDDILDKQIIVGLSYNALVDSLDKPWNFNTAQENELWFPVRVENDGIDPVYQKVLIVVLAKDSTVEKAELRERSHDGDYYTIKK